MNLGEALGFGAVQGATEFLPISSSGHLKLGEALFGTGEPRLLFDIVLHVGTLLSVMIFYRQEIAMVLTGLADAIKGLAAERSIGAALRPPGARLALLIVLATIPTGAIGLLLEGLIDPDQGASPVGPIAVCALLIINGAILMMNALFQRRQERLSAPKRTGKATLWSIAPWVAIAIGVAQGIAVLPGLSRSGLTITCALALGVERIQAARYSFLLSIPAILGALALKFDASLFRSGADVLPFALGALSAAAVGYVCLIVLTRMLERAQFHHFAWYCWALGLGGLAWFWLAH